jgi:hypothetical protein
LPRRCGCGLTAGRFFAAADWTRRRVATIVNEELVRQHLAVPQVTGLHVPGLIPGHGEATLTARSSAWSPTVLKDGNDKGAQPEIYVVHGGHGAAHLRPRQPRDPDGGRSLGAGVGRPRARARRRSSRRHPIGSNRSRPVSRRRWTRRASPPA